MPALTGQYRRKLMLPPGATTNPLDLLEKYLQHIQYIDNLAIATVQNRRYILAAFLQRINADDIQTITLDQIDTYLMQRSQEVKPSSVDMEKQAMRGFFAYCQVRKLIELQFDYRVIKRTKQKPPRVDPITMEQICAVVHSIGDEQLQLIICVMAETGLRMAELLNLELGHINGSQIRIRGKGSKDRIVIMPPDLARSLVDFAHTQGIESGCVFRPKQQHYTHRSDRYTSAYAVRDRIKAAFKKQGIDMHPHELRHAYAFHWLEKGGDIRTLQLLLGHENLEVTQRYLGVSDRYLLKIANMVHPKSILSLEL